MPTKSGAEVVPDVLIWARKSARLNTQQAAKKVGVSEERLLEWENGTTLPSFPQLRSLAAAYKRPLSVFLLSEPPKGYDVLHIPDYRILADSEWADLSPELAAELRWASDRRNTALEIAGEQGDVVPLLPLRLLAGMPPEVAAATVRELLGIPLDEQFAWRDPHTPLNRWRDSVEALGVLVFHTERVRLEEMRGCSISEIPLPIILLNGSDSPRGRLFTLLHELVHLLVETGGICDLAEGVRRIPQISQLEVFCNRVAGAVLIPRQALFSEPILSNARLPRDWDDVELRYLAGRYSVSEEAMLRRLVVLGAATEQFYRQKREDYLKIYAEQKKKGMEAGAQPAHFRMVLRRNGPTYTRMVLDAYYRRSITASDVASLLDVKWKHIPLIEKEVFS